MRRVWSIAMVAFLAAGCGDGSPTEPDGPNSEAWLDVTAGIAHACALADDGAAYCWGDNERGQLGDGTTVPRTAPVRVVGVPPLVSIDASDHGTCGLDEDGAAFCWGRGGAGELGNGVLADAPAPVQVLAGPFESLSVGSYMACGVGSGGLLTCWGADRYDALLAGSPEVCPGPNAAPFWRCASVPVERPGAGAFRTVSVGVFHVCGVRPEGEAVCWGMGRFGQLGVVSSDLCAVGVPAGDPSTPCRREPAPLTPAMTAVSAGASHSCGVGPAGRVHCWGGLLFDYGQVGTGAAGTETPAPVAGQTPFRRVYTAGVNRIFTFSCALDAEGAAACWGAGDDGQLGSTPAAECGGVPCTPVPAPVAGGHRFEALALGGGFACGIALDDAIYCWGRNDVGQLGRGNAGAGGADPVRVAFAGS